jgi:hypothetical protein
MQHLDGGRLRRGGGVPRVNWNHPLAQGLLVALIDVGGRVYDAARNYRVYSGNLSAARGGSPFGTTINWQESWTNSSYGIYVKVGDLTGVDPESQITHASDLIDKGTGAAFSFASAFYCTDASGNEQFVFGRPAWSQELAPYANWSFQLRSAADGGVGVACYVNNNNVLNQVGGGATVDKNNVPYNPFEYTSCAGVFFNTASGSATCLQYQQGKLVNTSTGIAVATSNIDAGHDPSSQLMLGSIYHVAASGNPCYIPFSGNVYYGYAWTRELTPAEVSLLHSSPYCFLVWPEDEIDEAVFGSGGTTYTLAEATGSFALSGYALSPPVARYMKRTATLLGEA